MPPSDSTPAGTDGTAPATTFEAAYGELRQVIEQLEAGGLALEESVRLFERGTELVRACEQIVDGAELRVQRLASEPAAPFPEPLADE